MMGKVFIVLDEQEQLTLEMILVDRDEKEALKFLKNHIASKLKKKKKPCSETALYFARPQR